MIQEIKQAWKVRNGELYWRGTTISMSTLRYFFTLLVVPQEAWEAMNTRIDTLQEFYDKHKSSETSNETLSKENTKLKAEVEDLRKRLAKALTTDHPKVVR